MLAGTSRNAILRSAATLIEAVLARRDIQVARPVAAQFRTNQVGSSGIEIIVTLRDPSLAAHARRAITEHLGGESSSDRLLIA